MKHPRAYWTLRGGSLVACYRYIVDTMALKAFQAEFGEKPKAESKNRKRNRFRQSLAS